MPRRERWPAVAAALAAILLTGCGGSRTPAPASSLASVHPLGSVAPRARSSSEDRHAVTATRQRRNAAIPADPRAPANARAPGLQHLQAVTFDGLRGQGETGALIRDLTTGQTLYTHDANVARAPASLEKLYTTVALLRLLGPDARLHTQMLGSGHLAPGGVWDGNLYLRGDGDPTFGDGTWNRGFEDGAGPTSSQLVADLRRDGIRRVTGFVYGDESRFDTDRGGPLTAGQPDVPDYGGELSALVFDHGATGGGLGPAAFAAHEVVLSMRTAGIRARSAPATAVTPPGAHVLATLASPPMATMLRLMDVPSDDLFADLFAYQLGWQFVHQGTLAAGAIEIRQVLAADYGLHPVIYDGSGLDKADRSSPADFVSLFTQLRGTPTGADLDAALPVVGETGTVQPIGVGTPAQGRCVAKTGTLNDVTNLAGLCHAKDGHLIAFALMFDGPANWQALERMSPMVGAIAGY